PGGVGKTRLALQAAADALESFPGGAFLVRLGEVVDPSLVLPAIASTLGVREGGGLDLPASLAAYLGDRRFLLVLDNFEQLTSAAADIGRLLEQCRHLRILISSRAPVHLPGERWLEVGPRAHPAPRWEPADVSASPAAVLFARRAAAAAGSVAIDRSNAADVALIVQRLDGLPLAIELAAARLRFQTPGELLSDLYRRLDLDAAGVRAGLRHKSTHAATIAWSYDRLTPRQQEILQRLSLFTGGCTPDAMRLVIPAPGDPADDLDAEILQLADESLLRRDGSGGERRWSMLRTINRFAAERFRESAGRDETAARYLRWAMDLAETQNARIAGPDQAAALAALEREHDNFISALALLRESGDGQALASLVLALHRFWRVRGHLTEGRRWLRATLDLTDAPLPDRMRACLADGQFALQQGDYRGARLLFDEGLAIARSSGDEGREAAFLVNLGALALTVGELTEADQRFSSALSIAERLGDTPRRLDALANLGALAHYRGDVASAAARYAECLRLREDLGDIRGAAEMAINLLLLLAPIPAHRDRARALGEQALARMESVGDRPGMGVALTGLGWLLDAAGDPGGARNRHLQALALFEEVGDPANIARAMGNAGLAEVSIGEVESGMRRLQAALRHWADLQEPPGIAASLDGLAWAVRSMNPAAAARWARAAHQIRKRHDLPMLAEFAPRFGEIAETLAIHGIELDEALGAGPDIDERATILEALGDLADRPVERMTDLLAGLDDDLGLPGALHDR
ncbi:MAG: ATP-binding protein, partial [Chloroflexota bacterium]